MKSQDLRVLLISKTADWTCETLKSIVQITKSVSLPLSHEQEVCETQTTHMTVVTVCLDIPPLSLPYYISHHSIVAMCR